MKYPSIVRPFLDGSQFSNGYALEIKSEYLEEDRIALLEKMVKGKKVIHVGCADHLPLIEEKRRQGIWLHDRLTAACDEVIGLDYDHSAVAYLKENGIDNIYLMDIIEDDCPAVVKRQHWDIMVMGEIVEHLDNPVLFIKMLKARFVKYVDSLVLTTPNAFRYDNWRAVIGGKEYINSDHRYWFTPYTLAKILQQAGLAPDEFYFVNACNPVSLRKRLFYKRYPQLKDTLIVTARFSR